jgi:hypothetical protein
MSQKQVFTCDECGVEKKETNHWVIGFIGEPPDSVTFVAWSARRAEVKEAIHLCGEGCAGKVLSKAIAGWRG